MADSPGEPCLAQVNVARMRFAPDHPRMSGFFDALERINRLAESSEGFIWRLEDEAAEAEAQRLFGDERLLFNLSLWRSPTSLKSFVYSSEHADFVRRRNEWFQPMDGPAFALWWHAADTLPSVLEARHRLELLRIRGPSEDAFTFARAADFPSATRSGTPST